MAATAENQMNLAALQQRDPYITDIVDTASQVALYSFNPKANEWEKTDIEGTLFVYTRSARPTNGFMILNRLGLNDLIEPINRNLEFQLQDPFLLYRNAQAVIHGIWFYDKDECARIGQLMNSLVQVSSEFEDKENVGGRQRRASESDSILESKVMGKSSPGAAVGSVAASNVDILQMLYKAQDEYDKSKSETVIGKAVTPPGDATVSRSSTKGKRDLAPPKPMINNPKASATKTNNDLIRPLARKASPSQDETDHAADPITPGTQSISLETLFRRATMQQDHSPIPPSASSDVASAGAASSQMPPLLQRMMSNPGGGTTVEEVERQHRLPHSTSSNRDLMPQPAGAENPLPNIKPSKVVPRSVPYSAVGQHASVPQPDSPNTAIKRSLNMVPAVSSLPASTSLTASSTARLKTSKSSHLPEDNMIDPGLASFAGAAATNHPRPMTAGLAAGPAQPPVNSVRGSSSLTAQSLPAVQKTVQSGVDLTSSCDSASMSLTGGRVGAGPGVDALITPQALLKGDPLPAHQASGVGVESGGLGILLSPMAFQGRGTSPPNANYSLPPPNTVKMTAGDGEISVGPEARGSYSNGNQSVNPLTKSQLQQALIHMLKNDASFLDSIHNAYVQSLHQSMQSRSNRL